MAFWDWIALSIAVPAALLLIVACVVSAVRMKLKDAKDHQQLLFLSLAIWMLVVGLQLWLNIYEMPVLGIFAPLVPAFAGFYTLYLFIVSVTLLFRSRFRRIGYQMLIACTLAMWWMALTEQYLYPHEQQASTTVSEAQK